MLFIVVILNNCDSIEHHNQIDELYMKMCSIMMQCSSSSIPTSKAGSPRVFKVFKSL